MSQSERYLRGAQKFTEVIGQAPPEMGEKGSDFLTLTIENLFADVWAREGLSVRDRRLVTLTVLTLLTKEDSLLGHLRQALKSGDLSKKEIEELMIHLTAYAGWPVGSFGFDVAMKVFAELRKPRPDTL
jgi:4-carboxymuconolactone decarboxylase